MPRVESGKDRGVSLAADDNLAQEMGELMIDKSTQQPQKRGRPNVWLVDWDTTVSILPHKKKTRDTIQDSAAQALHQGQRVNTQFNTKAIANDS